VLGWLRAGNNSAEASTGQTSSPQVSHGDRLEIQRYLQPPTTIVENPDPQATLVAATSHVSGTVPASDTASAQPAAVPATQSPVPAEAPENSPPVDNDTKHKVAAGESIYSLWEDHADSGQVDFASFRKSFEQRNARALIEGTDSWLKKDTIVFFQEKANNSQDSRGS
jgi:hypothetical protein